jgi:hypothetical protein
VRFTKLSIIIKTDDKIPYFIGSQLRGALGYALKRVTCINPAYECEECFGASNCLFYSFYEQKNSFHKYRFDFELAKEYYDFSFYLFDEACDKLPYIISAFYNIITNTGLGKFGKDGTTYTDFELFINDKNCLINNQIKLPENYTKTLQIDNIYQDITLHLITPLRMKKNNRFIRDDSIELKDIINSIYQRQMKLMGRDYRRFPYNIEGEIVRKELLYKELTRKSNRQKTIMQLGGIMGKITIKNLSKECYEVLKVGELIGVGKSTVFGLGKIELFDLGLSTF